MAIDAAFGDSAKGSVGRLPCHGRPERREADGDTGMYDFDDDAQDISGDGASLGADTRADEADLASRRGRQRSSSLPPPLPLLLLLLMWGCTSFQVTSPRVARRKTKNNIGDFPFARSVGCAGPGGPRKKDSERRSVAADQHCSSAAAPRHCLQGNVEPRIRLGSWEASFGQGPPRQRPRRNPDDLTNVRPLSIDRWRDRCSGA